MKKHASEEKVSLDVTCFKCETTFSLEVLPSSLDQYEAGALVQNAFPYLSEDDRELIISRTCGACFIEIFSF
ncbi:asparagine synthetase A [Croceifilum oryzae]|uniref:Asparagine synthetase A n=1 Tax=Croceifilum oryzae TaxID=1553429 RepID=A0AAJ1WU76_9BACL|nr:hypothetical protein [Croceifilum oryzae]MDQ0418783.1 asparagine synthetase A [Croceifilum oryzae]